MAQDFSDLAHACAGAEHRPGETVPKQVGALKSWMQTGSIECATDDG
jgi:hypothetical protein